MELSERYCAQGLIQNIKAKGGYTGDGKVYEDKSWKNSEDAEKGSGLYKLRALYKAKEKLQFWNQTKINWRGDALYVSKNASWRYFSFRTTLMQKLR